jgi:cytochrome P450
MNAHTRQHFIPPRPAPPEHSLGWYRLLVALRTNALQIWPREAYTRDVLVQSFFGRRRFLLNAPDAIHHVLVDNTANYRRTSATVRILRPIVGEGLILSEGEEWRHQRRTIAPTLAPRVLPMLARHVAGAAQEAIARLAAGASQPVDLLAAMQSLTLEVAARSMFSLEMHRYGPALRRMISEFAASLGRPYFLDLMLPVGIPSWRDLARARFRTRWIALMDEIVGARLREPPSDQPRDLFDVLLAARDPETGAAFSPDQLRDQVATMIVAGHETTALTLFWSLSPGVGAGRAEPGGGRGGRDRSFNRNGRSGAAEAGLYARGGERGATPLSARGRDRARRNRGRPGGRRRHAGRIADHDIAVGAAPACAPVERS